MRYFSLLAAVLICAVLGLGVLDNAFAQVSGDTRYNTGTIQFYDAEDAAWRDVSTTTTAGSCSDAGNVRYSSSRLEFCNGTNWISMDQGISREVCSTAGASRNDADEFQFCNGSNWRIASVHPGCTTDDGFDIPHGQSISLAITNSGGTQDDACTVCGSRLCTCDEGTFDCAGSGYYIFCSGC